ncbi:glutamyl-tRNA reductase [Porphyromonas pogonae]|uniref:glutamyl-tRNA reductase n=1 Tax=Porphyromonas pogonae TaxID=867595 RepID=UPI002E7757CB|nr:glutamyl-tRNA reductase [Porphyromonas pogonae]
MIGLIGINHKSADVGIRELYALAPAEGIAFVESLISTGMIEGAMVLSTCNRLEVYYETRSLCPSTGLSIITRLEEYNHLQESSAQLFYRCTGREVYDHLFRLASGLDSMVVGETQILGQLKDAFRRATDNSQSTSVLSRMFHKAFETAKKIRSQYLISSTPISAGSAAVNYMTTLGIGKDEPTLIIGAGQMAETIYDTLMASGYSDIRVYNRTRERAEKFTVGRRLKCYCEGELDVALADACQVYAATSSLTPVVTRQVMPFASDRPVYMFDMAVPRNIAEDVAQLNHVHVYTIDDLKKAQGEESDYSMLNEPEIEACLQEKIEELVSWTEASRMREVISLIQEATAKLLEKEMAHLPNQLTSEEIELISRYDEHFRITMSTAIISSLKQITNDGQNMKYAESVNRLFKNILTNI